jgi:hypothetical protein
VPEPLATGPFAHIEDLDPPPARPASQMPRWELVLGLLLVLSVTGFASWQWWDQQTRLTHYREGARAMAALDWTAAHRAFLAAAGYADADKRAADAAGLEKARNTAYAAASAAAAAEHWTDLVSPVARLQTLGPQYRDTPRLKAAVEQHVYLPTLSGTVVLRPDARPPGLYTYDAGGWRALPGSDRTSTVLATCPDGGLVYDAAWHGPGPVPTPEPGRLPVRRVLVGARGGTAPFALVLDPDRFDLFRCTGTGVWGIRTLTTLPGAPASAPVPQRLVAYQPFTATTAISPADLGANWTVAGPAPDGRHLLLYETSALTGAGGQTGLYLADVDGRNPRRLAGLPGAPGPALPVAAGPDLVVSAYLPVAGTRAYTNTVLLVDPAGARPPRSIVEVRVPAATFDDHFQVQIQVVDAGPRAGQVLVIWPADSGTVVRLVDPVHRDRPWYDIYLSQRQDARVLATDSADGGLILAASRVTAQSRRPDDRLVYIDPHDRATEIAESAGSPDQILAAWVRGDYLVYATGAGPNIGFGGPKRYIFRSLPRGQLTGIPTVVYAATVDRLWPPLGPPWWAGADLLAYVTPDGELHGRSYDGHQDILLDTGVTAFAREAFLTP